MPGKKGMRKMKKKSPAAKKIGMRGGGMVPKKMGMRGGGMVKKPRGMRGGGMVKKSK